MHQWSTTPLNNQTADSRANWQEGQPASSLNNSARGVMATAAFWRDDNLGTLVATLGAGNVYTVSTGQGLIDPASTAGGGTPKISHPFSLRVVLPAMNTPVATTAPTIIIDGAAAVPLKRRDGSALADGDLIGVPVEILGDTVVSGAVTRVRALDDLPSDIRALMPTAAAVTPPGSCRLVYTSATELTLIPYQGNLVQANGAARTVPPATDPNRFKLSNVGLTAGTQYYVYMPPTGTALEASTTGHVTAADGTEVKSGDPTRALLATIYTDAGSPGTFADSPTKRYVASWFNPPVRHLLGAYAGGSTSSTTLVELNTQVRVYFVAFAGQVIDATAEGYMFNTTQGAVNYVQIGLDGTAFGAAEVQSQQTGDQTSAGPLNVRGVTTLSEGFHYITTLGHMNAGYNGTGSFLSAICGRIN